MTMEKVNKLVDLYCSTGKQPKIKPLTKVEKARDEAIRNEALKEALESLPGYLSTKSQNQDALNWVHAHNTGIEACREAIEGLTK